MTDYERAFETAMDSSDSIYADVRTDNLLRAIAYGLAWIATELEEIKRGRT